jgi:arylsulfatase A-like enzyme
MQHMNRRDFLKTVSAGVAALGLPEKLLAEDQDPASPKAAGPNIVWIYCDELRTDALGCYGHPRLKLHTPNLDRLASGGVRFTNQFCNSPVCVPSRVATLSGRYPEETGVYNNEAAWASFRLPELPVTFPQVFAQRGYATASFGKIHVATGMYPDQTPGYAIFQKNSQIGAEMNYWSNLGKEKVQMIYSPIGGMQGGVFPSGVPYPPDKVADNTIAWMKTATAPWFVRLSILQPHTPVLPPAEFYNLYADQDPGLPDKLPVTVSAFERRVAEVNNLDRMDLEKLRTARRAYYAQVAWVDSQVGRVLDVLEHKGQLQNTVIVFGADHGTPVGENGAKNKPLRPACIACH